MKKHELLVNLSIWEEIYKFDKEFILKEIIILIY